MNLEEQRKTIFQQIDIKSKEIIDALNKAPVYIKNIIVKIRPATQNEKIITILNDGEKETINIAKIGDWIVTNPSNEQYIINNKNYLEHYKETGEAGFYIENNYCKAIKNPFNKPIKINAPWGFTQIGDEKCLIVNQCKIDGTFKSDPYLVDIDSFEETYKKLF